MSVNQIKDKDSIKNYYEQKNVASAYIRERFSNPSGKVQHLSQVKFINDAIRIYKPNSILEIAPGPARLSRHIKTDAICFCADRSSAMLKEAKSELLRHNQMSKWNLILLDAFLLPFKDSSFDCIYSFRFFRHFPFDERKKLFAECKRTLRQGGILIFDGENKNVVEKIRIKSGIKEPPIYDELFTPDELNKEAEKNGFKQVKISGNLNCPGFLRNLDRLNKLGMGNLAYHFSSMFNSLMQINPLEWIVIWKKK